TARATPADMQAARQETGVDLTADIEAAIRTTSALPPPRVVRILTGVGSKVTALVRFDGPDIQTSDSTSLVLINPDLLNSAPTPVPSGALPSSAGLPLRAGAAAVAELRPGEVRIVPCRRTEPVISQAPGLARPWSESSRIAVENVQPGVTGGDFAAKSIVGRELAISADVFGDGHDVLAACVLWRPADETAWHRVAMRGPENDRWEAVIRPDRIGLYHFAVEGWWDQWGTFTHDLHAKVAAGQNVALELEEGRQLLEQGLTRAQGEARSRLQAVLAQPLQSEILLRGDIAAAMHDADDRPFAARSPVYALRVDRPAAEFASWYELFPRSATHDARVHGTFLSVIERLPDIRAMGFDVLYFPPINPIGRVNRKGRNNSLRAEPGDVGSPYAIGSAEGGHDAVNPALGTLDDFRLLQREAHEHGLEIALDFAIQCAPDHPWIAEHKDWFRWRPDGSMRYAENPPKKYEDIVNPDFYGSASFPAVWIALRDVIRFWVDQGIRIFRVDNPHTKPLPFWQWMIADIQSDHPDVLFLSEAFTRPKLMYRLAKVGFSQSYTYFTWRNTKQEITEYLTEITAPPVAYFFRPNFFVNTPDINPIFLQTSGRPGFLIRAALAATLSGLWGVYSGFELCESAPLPGREEYLDSEKYEIRPRDYHAPGHINAEIAALNRIRRLNPALQTHLGVRFYTAHNDQVILYGKRDAAAGTLILIAVSFDPRSIQEADIEVPVWELGVPDNGAVAVTDLMNGHNFTWYGKNQRIRLDPSALPFHIWRLSRVGVT
ncbi:MAG TPA: alpha-1,4-glucan--maltose-1-phosphate maltosyltransferase, partial [Rhodopila sp.]|nr:alpha-1,4-glucan--maltose-1-phosphate maltosyltransferase [Rhodopila sp.]